MKNVLVTGGSGFIGTHLVNGLLAQSYTVINFDINPPHLTEHMPMWYEGNILNGDDLRTVFQTENLDSVIHLAARAEIYSKDLSKFASIYDGTRHLIDAASESPAVKRLLNTSSQLVVGPGKFPKSDVDYSPYTIYGKAKAEAERVLRERNPDFVWLTIRPTNIWGPYHPSFGKSIWYYLYRRYYLHPNLKTPVIRCYGYVKNTVDQIINLMTTPEDAVHRRVLRCGGNPDAPVIFRMKFGDGLRKN